MSGDRAWQLTIIPFNFIVIPRREKHSSVPRTLTVIDQHSLVAAPGGPHTELRIIPRGTLSSREINWKNFKSAWHLVEVSHFKMYPEVQVSDWNVVLSADPTLPVCLLEVNLSRGTFDRAIF